MHHALIPFLLAVPLAAQTTPAGYQAAVRALPAGSGSALLEPSGAVVYCTGNDLLRNAGGQISTLIHFQSSVFGSFTRAVGPAGLLFGESSNGGLWLVPPTGAPRVLATLAFNYDAALWQPGHALVSAKTGGFGAPDNEVWAVDLATGTTDLIARLPGASGPLAVAPDGTLFYATASNTFPPPRGSSEVLAFSAAQVRSAFGPTVLTLAEARRVASSFDSAGALALDDDGDLFLVDWQNHRIWELDDGGARHTFLQYPATGAGPGGLQFLHDARAPQGPVFEPFQPEQASLVVGESDFAAVSQLRIVRAQRPTLSTPAARPIPVGPFALHSALGPASGTAVVFLGYPQRGGEHGHPVPGAEAPLFWSMDLALPWIALPVLLDTQGAGTLPLVNPGGIGLIAAQGLLFDAAPTLAGTSAPTPLPLAR